MLATAHLLGPNGRCSPSSACWLGITRKGLGFALAGVGFALLGASLSLLRLSPAVARGADYVRVQEDQRLKGE
jgi:DHA2 family multidrug resistance protein-like MFS transporter